MGEVSEGGYLVKPEFSEFTYAYAYTHEVISTHRGIITTPPTLPSLIAEKKLGYDVSLSLEGWLYFAQFKVADFLFQARAKQWHYYQAPYFRFEIGRREDIHQHEALLRLAHKSGAYMVEYVAPRMHSRDSLDNAFATKTVFGQSLRVKATGVNSSSLNSSEQTYVTYRETGPPTAWSEPSDILEPHHFGDLRQPAVEVKAIPLQDETFETVHADILSAARGQSAITAVVEATAGLPAWIRAEIAARLLLDATLIAIPSGSSSRSVASRLRQADR